jgi:hypothetical protein
MCCRLHHRRWRQHDPPDPSEPAQGPVLAVACRRSRRWPSRLPNHMGPTTSSTSPRAALSGRFSGDLRWPVWLITEGTGLLYAATWRDGGEALVYLLACVSDARSRIRHQPSRATPIKFRTSGRRIVHSCVDHWHRCESLTSIGLAPDCWYKPFGRALGRNAIPPPGREDGTGARAALRTARVVRRRTDLRPQPVPTRQRTPQGMQGHGRSWSAVAGKQSGAWTRGVTDSRVQCRTRRGACWLHARSRRPRVLSPRDGG